MMGTTILLVGCLFVFVGLILLRVVPERNKVAFVALNIYLLASAAIVTVGALMPKVN